ncbi:MAG: LysR family transcriptional regulator [Actinobacteria bacterium]|nr:LysR family transcriptional regulator [Actinomycetota bacterium]
MDTRLLRTFHAVVEHGSFTSAATALGYTQSAVSQHVAALEASLGVELFRRRPFALTPAAVRLAEHAGNILMRLDVATSELRAVDSSQCCRRAGRCAPDGGRGRATRQPRGDRIGTRRPRSGRTRSG